MSKPILKNLYRNRLAIMYGTLKVPKDQVCINLLLYHIFFLRKKHFLERYVLRNNRFIKTLIFLVKSTHGNLGTAVLAYHITN